MRQIANLIQFNQRRFHKGSGCPLFAVLWMILRRLKHLKAFIAHGLNMALNVGFGLFIDHRADIGGQALRIAHTALRHRATQHFQRMFRDVLLNAQQTQRRAALTRAVKGRGDDIDHHLFCQGG